MSRSSHGGPTPQRGFFIWIYLAAGVAVLAALAYAAREVYQAGRNAVLVEQAEANAKLAAEAKAARDGRAEAIDRATGLLAAAQRAARDWETKWRRERDRKIPLSSCDSGPTATQPAAVGPDSHPRLRLTYGFLREYDGVWTGADGQPVFRDPDGAAAGSPAPGQASGLGLEELLDAHAENASRCSENARQLTKLVSLLKELRASATPRQP